MNTSPTPKFLPRLVAAVLAGTALARLTGATAGDDDTPSYLPPSPAEIHRLGDFHVRAQTAKNTYIIQRTGTATKTDTPLVNVPQAISVITRELIEDQNMLSIGDVTRYVPGAGIAQGEGNRDTPVLRGNSTTADFFIDGVRDDVQYFRDLYNADRIEVLKGPNAMIFGRGGSGGLLNRVTKQATHAATREVTLQAGSWGQFRGALDFGGALSDKTAYRLNAMHEEAGSHRDGVTLRRSGANPVFLHELTPATRLRFGYEYFHDERVADRGVPSFAGRPLETDASTFFGDPARSHSEADVHTVFASIEHRFGTDLHLRNHTRFSTYEKFYQNVYPGAVNTALTTVSVSAYNNATERDNFFNQTDLVWSVATGSLRHEILAGLELGRQATGNVRLTGYFESISPTTTSVQVPLGAPRTTLPLAFRPGATDADNHGVARTVALYVQDQIQLTGQLLLIAGVRYDRFTVDFRNNRTGAGLGSRDNTFSPRAGLIYKPREEISLYGSYSMSFVPRAGEQLSSLSASNRSLDPEEFKNLEAGAKWDLRTDLALSAALYQLDRTNVAIADPADPTRSLLVDGQRARGLELALTGRLSRNWSIAGGYAWQDGEILATQSATIRAGSRLAQLPRHTFSLWNRYDFDSAWGAGLGLIHRGGLFASTDNAVTLPGFTRLDAAVFYRFDGRFRAQLNIENLLDRDYSASAHNNNNITPGSPRAFRVSVTASF